MFKREHAEDRRAEGAEGGDGVEAALQGVSQLVGLIRGGHARRGYDSNWRQTGMPPTRTNTAEGPASAAGPSAARLTPVLTPT
jgi:hypothetical protein